MPVFPSTLVPQLVPFLQLDGTPCSVNASWVSGLTPVPANLLPSLVPAGTYIDLSGDAPTRVAVVGTLAAVTAALLAGNAGGFSRELLFAGVLPGGVAPVSVALLNSESSPPYTGTEGFLNPLDLDTTLDRLHVLVLKNTLTDPSQVDVLVNGALAITSGPIPAGATGTFTELTTLGQWNAGARLTVEWKSQGGGAGNLVVGSVTLRARN